MNERYERLCRNLLCLVAAARGQGLVEYAAILGFLAACLVVAELFLEPHIASTLNDVANHFP
jgi:Flp pilus assembly pilin Flp